MGIIKQSKELIEELKSYGHMTNAVVIFRFIDKETVVMDMSGGWDSICLFLDWQTEHQMNLYAICDNTD